VLAKNSKVLATTMDASVVPVALFASAQADVGDVATPANVPTKATRSITLVDRRTLWSHMSTESPGMREEDGRIETFSERAPWCSTVHTLAHLFV